MYGVKGSLFVCRSMFSLRRRFGGMLFEVCFLSLIVARWSLLVARCVLLVVCIVLMGVCCLLLRFVELLCYLLFVV